jgi:hypothetical protein
LDHLGYNLISILPSFNSTKYLQGSVVVDGIRLTSYVRTTDQELTGIIQISYAHSINDDIVVSHVVGLTPLGAHEVDQLHSLSVASRTARHLEDDVVGDHIGCAPTTEHVIEHHKRLAQPLLA